MDRGTIIRTIVLLIALINQFLTSSGLNPIPGSEQIWGEVLAWLFTVTASTWTWFRNNYITAKGKRQKEVLTKEGLAKE